MGTARDQNYTFLDCRLLRNLESHWAPYISPFDNEAYATIALLGYRLITHISFEKCEKHDFNVSSGIFASQEFWWRRSLYVAEGQSMDNDYRWTASTSQSLSKELWTMRAQCELCVSSQNDHKVNPE